MLEFLIIAGASIGSLSWISILFLPWRPWDTRESLEANVTQNSDLGEITVLIPARNEADTIAQTLKALNQQGPHLKIILIDDQSEDPTAVVARATSTQDLTILSGTELPAGWAGKLWALQQGSAQVKTPYILLLDADIELAPQMIDTLFAKIKNEDLDLVSIMAHLRMQTFFEKLLIPSFIYFFKLLYPFSMGNNPKSRLGVAAGGCVLLKTEALKNIGGFEALRGALIDDCTLAQKFKDSKRKTWIGLSRSVTSHRGYGDLKSLWNMVARSAFTQLKYSTSLLIGCTLIMASMFWFPLIGLFSSLAWVRILSMIGLYAMIRSYLPILSFYRRSPLWSLSVPLIGSLYLGMTWTSALRYWRGKRSEWKGRTYAKAA